MKKIELRKIEPENYWFFPNKFIQTGFGFTILMALILLILKTLE